MEKLINLSYIWTKDTQCYICLDPAFEDKKMMITALYHLTMDPRLDPIKLQYSHATVYVNKYDCGRLQSILKLFGYSFTETRNPRSYYPKNLKMDGIVVNYEDNNS